ncbi:MAG: HIT family protein [Clostridia bacterium]
MLIKFASEQEKKAYGLSLSKKVLIAKKRRTKEVFVLLVFNNENIEKIIDLKENEKAIQSLKKCANRLISKNGYSFHHRYDKYSKMMDEKNCPVCLQLPMPEDQVDIFELEHSYLGASINAQGKLYGKCHLISKVHNVHFYDLNEEDMTNFMRDLKKVAKALHKVTDAVKINYEIHGNSTPHLHCHLFPRYIDDDYPGMSINYSEVEPSPYDSKEDFDFFVKRMREELNK